MIEEAYAETRDLMASVREACTHVVGAYGLAAVCADEPGVIAVARKDSPIVVGVGETGSYVASDVIALIDATRDVVVLEDGQFAKLTPAGVEYTDEAGNVIEPRSPISTGTWTWPKRAVIPTLCSRRFTSSRAWCATRWWVA